jgi:hypothetical protein
LAFILVVYNLLGGPFDGDFATSEREYAGISSLVSNVGTSAKAPPALYSIVFSLIFPVALFFRITFLAP